MATPRRTDFDVVIVRGGMDGAWFVYRPGEKWRHPAFKVRAIVGTALVATSGYDS